MDEKSLIDNIITYLKDSNIIFIVGLLMSFDGLAAADIFMRDIKTYDQLKNFKRLKTLKNSLSEPGGYVFADLNKLVIFLQDDPDQISYMMSGYIIPLINQRYLLKSMSKNSALNDIKFNKEDIKNKNNKHLKDRYSKTNSINSKIFPISIIFLMFIVFIVLYLFLSS